jgi:excisionase family DNA binding protein
LNYVDYVDYVDYLDLDEDDDYHATSPNRRKEGVEMSAKSLYLKVPEVAEMLEMDPTTIYKMCKDGEIPSIRIGEKAVRVPRAALDAYLERQAGRGHQGRELLDAVHAGGGDPVAALEHQALSFSKRVGCSPHQFVEQWRAHGIEDTPETTDIAIEALSLKAGLDRTGISDRVQA